MCADAQISFSFQRTLAPFKQRNPMKILMVLTSHDKLGNTGKKTGFA